MKESTASRDRDRIFTSWVTRLCCQPDVQLRTVAAVLTLRQGIKRPDGTWEQLSREEASRLVLKIRKKIDRIIFKSSGRRFGHRLPVLATFEGETTDERLHLNFSITIPDERTPEEIIEAFRTAGHLELPLIS